MTISAGTYRCEVVANSLAHSKEKQTPSVKLQLGIKYNILNPEYAEHGVLYHDLYLTEKSFENSMKTLAEVFGWTGIDISELNSAELLAGIECNAVVEIEEYDGKTRPKVKFINNPNRMPQPTMEDEAAKVLAESLKGRLLAFRQKNPMKAIDPVRNDAAAIEKAGKEAVAAMNADTGLPF
jgi:hypothetical protein